MLVFRSLVFNLAFYLNMALWLVVGLPCFVFPRRNLQNLMIAWAGSSMWLMKVIVGTRVEARGLENLQQGGLLVASKHQSLWETFALLPYFDDAAFVLKRELSWIPLFGWYILKSKMIPVDRNGTISAIKSLTAKSKEAVEEGRQLIIFPEGTRRAPGAEPSYKSGTTHLYKRLGKPCLPVALNSGLFWPRRKFLRYPGTIVIEFLPIIPAGLKADEFEQQLQTGIETSSNRLWKEGLEERERLL
ncbi:lysophospholipid acyltransferase family protein [Microvirga sp. W0021]|uniref:Lysophospholipid acyltransferase family protein n=1 Tax=Hohaiivirga grylli TaxID=3133970 RepID=A0ABV0BL43_9HYPH